MNFFKGKQLKVVITGNAKKELFRLKKKIDEDKNSEYQKLSKSIFQKIEFLKHNPQYGIHIEKRKIPKEYFKDYNVNNLWKVNLFGVWRLIYTLRGSDIEIISIVLDILDHKTYDKKFKYRKR